MKKNTIILKRFFCYFFIERLVFKLCIDEEEYNNFKELLYDVTSKEVNVFYKLRINVIVIVIFPKNYSWI